MIAGMREGAREVAGQISRPCASGRETAAASPLLGVLSFWGDETRRGRWSLVRLGDSPTTMAAAM